MPGSWQHNRIHPSLSKFDAIRHVCAFNSHYLSAFSNSKTFAQRQSLVTGKLQRECDMSPCPLLPNHLNRIFSSQTRNNVSCLPFKDEWFLKTFSYAVRVHSPWSNWFKEEKKTRPPPQWTRLKVQKQRWIGLLKEKDCYDMGPL